MEALRASGKSLLLLAISFFLTPLSTQASPSSDWIHVTTHKASGHEEKDRVDAHVGASAKSGHVQGITYRFERASRGKSEQPLRFIQGWGKKSSTVTGDLSADGVRAIIRHAYAVETFYNGGSYSWIGEADITFIDGTPVGKPDRYEVKFKKKRLNRYTHADEERLQKKFDRFNVEGV